MRALRRHHLARVKCIRKKRFPMSDKIAGKLANTSALCSCAMCGNPRRMQGERKLRERSDIEMMQVDLIHI